MAGVMLLFAFSMSFVINLVGKKIDPSDDFHNITGKTDEMTKE